MMHILWTTIITSQILATLNTVSADELLSNPCSNGTTPGCTACIKRHPSCSWCSDENYSFEGVSHDEKYGQGYRCAPHSMLLKRGCLSSKIMFPTSSQSQPTTNKANTDADIDGDGEPIQLSPQILDVNLRLNDDKDFSFQFRMAKDYPVDLYFLADKSYSMRDILQSVSTMTNRIAAELTSITKRYAVGLGFFVDKPVFPYIDPNPSKQDDPCEASDAGVICEAAFGYEHVLSLTQKDLGIDNLRWKTDDSNVTLSGNLDGPEGALDALLQAALCNKEVGWRENSRKIILLIGDGGLHIAGDGKLAGLIEPFEEKCHLVNFEKKDKKNENRLIRVQRYSRSTVLDYPSLSQVATVLYQRNIAVIWAVKDNMLSLYQQVSEFLPVPSQVGMINADGSNIVTLLRSNYDKITNEVELDFDTQPGLHITVMANCTNDGTMINLETNNNKCPKMSLGSVVNYRVTMRASQCFDNGNTTVTFRVKGLSDFVTVNVRTLCQCACSSSTSSAVSNTVLSPKCNHQGSLECGACKCLPEYSGDLCECKTSASKNTGCWPTDVANFGQQCSGRGRCVCGKCKCSQNRYCGLHCEKDLQNCPRAWDDGTVCGGKQRGECVCSNVTNENVYCRCRDTHDRKACDCLKNPIEHCTDKANNKTETCSGRGQCFCGVCICPDGYRGKYCQVSSDSQSLCQSATLISCVRCYMRHVEAGLEKARANCNCTEVGNRDQQMYAVPEDGVSFASSVSETQDNSGNTCIVAGEGEDCRIFVTYKFAIKVYARPRVTLTLERVMQCDEKINAMYIVIGVILTIVVIGVTLLLIWKLMVTIHDKREYADFLKKCDSAKFETGENPMFMRPMTTVQNPLYGGLN